MSHQREELVRGSSLNILLSVAAIALTVGMSSGAARASAGMPRAASKVLVLAPSVVNPDTQFNWLGLAMQQSLVADLARQLPLQIEAGASSSNDAAEAMALAKKTGAGRVIISTIQLAGDQVRVTGQIIDGAHERVLPSLKATGRIDDLFEMEDQLASQVVRALTPPRPASTRGAPVAIAASGPVRLNYASADSQTGLQYTRPYENDRFEAAQDRYFFGSSCYGFGCSFGDWYGRGWCYRSYQPAAPGWAW